ncbi:hypothetical protein [Ancylobacter sp. FA202]|uniref:hypothetical protein n=1 Tax=Ancylobacter sp. FA202 TaxID=1111106 RepID=UPI0003769199|nr:hypothetical protein [Ancylobacter sp. FA202]
MDSSQPRFTAATACAVADVPAPTLRAWRNLNGLFADPDKDTGEKKNPGWSRFSMADLCVIRFVAQVTRSGLSAEAAVTFSKHIWLAFAMHLDGVEASRFALITDQVCSFLPPEATFGSYVEKREPDCPETAIFVDLIAIIAKVKSRLAEAENAGLKGKAP